MQIFYTKNKIDLTEINSGTSIITSWNATDKTIYLVCILNVYFFAVATTVLQSWPQAGAS